jgi:phage gp37-like protein
MPSVIKTYRNNIIAALSTSFLDTHIVRQVDKHGGLFDEKEIMRLCSITPSIYVSVLHVPQKGAFATGQGNFEIKIGVYVFTTAEASQDADDLGWNIAEAVAAMAQNNVFGSQVFQPHDIEIQNLWSRSLDDMNACIMAVGWCAGTLLGDDLDAIMLELQTQTVGTPTIILDSESAELGTPGLPSLNEPYSPHI